MVSSRESLNYRIRGAASALIVAGALYGGGIVVHSRTFAEVFDFICGPFIGVVIGVGLFVKWRSFRLIACIYVAFGIVVYILALLPISSPFEGVLSFVVPRLIIDLLVLLALVTQRAPVERAQSSNQPLQP